MSKAVRYFQNLPPRDINDATIFTTPIQVMVVDHKADLLGYVGDLLRSYAFEVTCVDLAGAALRILSERKETFDLLLVNSELKDVDIITFLRLAKAMDVLSMVMCEVEDDEFLLQALKSGASLMVQRPLTDDEVKKARQQVLVDRINKYHAKSKMLPETANIHERKIGRNHTENLDLEDDADFAKKKVCLEWTEELHTKFLQAVCSLGEGRCFPKDILETMGVPGLTRMQIASHLQKCRRDGWKFIGKRAPSLSKNMTFSDNSSHESSVDSRRFGRMPCVAPHSANQEERLPHYNDPPISNIGGQMDVNYMSNPPLVDPSHLNGTFGSFQNNGEVFCGPNAGQGSIFPPNQESNEYYEVMKDWNGNFSVPYADINVPGLNNHIMLEPNYNQGLPNQGNLMFNRTV